MIPKQKTFPQCAGDKMKQKVLSFVVKLQRPACRTPIKPLQKHKNAVKYDRKDEKKAILSSINQLGK